VSVHSCFHQLKKEIIMSDTQDNLRFPVGSKQYFIWIDFTRAVNNHQFTAMYLPWVDTLNNIEIKELTCIEHHKVSWDQDPKGDKDCDGFVFSEKNAQHQSARWFNQYPSASFGQLSDLANYKVKPDLTTEEIDALPDNMVWAKHVEAAEFLSTILRGIRDLKKQKCDKEVQALSEFYGKIVAKLKDEFKAEVTLQPLKLHRKDGTIFEESEATTVCIKSII
jgi:hypothetical protein